MVTIGYIDKLERPEGSTGVNALLSGDIHKLATAVNGANANSEDVSLRFAANDVYVWRDGGLCQS